MNEWELRRTSEQEDVNPRKRLEAATVDCQQLPTRASYEFQSSLTGPYPTAGRTAEWNIFVDPLAAETVFRSGAPIRLVPLDATNRVKIDAAFLAEFDKRELTRLGRFVREILATERVSIEGGYYYAWDPLAAAALVKPAVVTTTPMSIEIRRHPPETGRTAEVPGGKPNASVAIDADATAFRKLFLNAFTKN